MIEEGIFEFLQQNEALQEVLPSIVGVYSIYMGFVPESALYPCLLFEKVSSVNDTTLDGPSGYVITRYQFTALGKEQQNAPGSGYVSCQTVANVLRQQLNGLTGTLPDGTKLFNCILDNVQDIYDNDGQTHNAIQDYFFHFQQNP